MSDPCHIGHVPGFGVPSDIFARYMRMVRHNVLMVFGSDEHDAAIQVKTDSEGLTARECADRYHRVIASDLQGLGLSYSLYTHATTPNHYRVVQEVFRTLYDNNYVTAQTQMGAISPSTGRTLPDRFIEGTCPIRDYIGARSDQCDSYGNQLDPTDLINPVSRINGETLRSTKTEHFLLDLSKVTEQLTTWLDFREDQQSNVLKFNHSLLGKIRPRAITRDLDWGVPIPLRGWVDTPMKRIYMWFDAVVGYLSVSIERTRRSGDPDTWRRFWNEETAQSSHFMGRDDIVFHSVVWPGILLGVNGQGAAGGKIKPALGELQLPTEVASSESVTTRGSKVSSSRGAPVFVGDFLGEFGPDALRYFIAVAGPEGQDTDFTWEEFVRRVNLELASEWGNLVNRSISVAHKNNGAIPRAGGLTEANRELLGTSVAAFETVGEHITARRFKASTTEAMRIVSLANKHLSDQGPWKLKDDPVRRDTVLHVALQVVSDCNTLSIPYLPHSAQAVFGALDSQEMWAARPELGEVTDGEIAYPILIGDYTTQQAVWECRPVIAGILLAKPSPLFHKLNKKLTTEGPS